MSDTAGPQSVFWALFSRKGRIRRQTYGLGMALLFCIWWVVLSQLFSAYETGNQFETWLMVLGLIALVSTYCIYALCAKRLQDLGYPGYFALVLVAIGFFLSGFMAIPLLLLGLLRGEEKPNAFGPPPVKKRTKS